jgi:hypothetical protein
LPVRLVLVSLLASVSVLPGCRRDETPSEGKGLLALVPEGAQLLFDLDLAALRRSRLFASLAKGSALGQRALGVGFDPGKDLDEILLAATSRRGSPGELEFLTLFSGRFDERTIAPKGANLVEERRRGRLLRRVPEEGGPVLIVPRPGLLASASPGWVDPLLDRLEGRGRSVLSRSRIGAAVRSLEGKSTAWATAVLSPEAAELLATRLARPELRGARSVSAAVVAGRELSGRVTVELAGESEAGVLAARLEELLRRSPGLGVLDDLDVRREASSVHLRGRIGASRLEALVSSLH